ncbi:MAG TPA: hypothetical protein VE131_07925 [Terriglobales bacterium]|nr:hypothetical protein [Terriglobales bacterium]
MVHTAVYQFREILHAAPFQAFTIHMADGRSLPVAHPDFIAIMPDGETIIVVSAKEKKPSFALVDVPLITQLDVQGARKSHD